MDLGDPDAAPGDGDAPPPRAGGSVDPADVAAVLDAADHHGQTRGAEARGGAAGLSSGARGTGAADDSPLLRAAITVRPAEPGAAGDVAPLEPDHPEFQSIVRRSVVDEIRAHAAEHPGIEVCGVLVGTVYEGPQAAFTYVDGMIRGDGSSGRSTQVTFTAETWQHVHRVMEAEHPGKRIIGWYHTHPGFGIFLSEMDLFIQRHFFSAAWQVAYVLDPNSRESGMFAWRQADVRRVEFVVDDASAGQSPEAMFQSLPALSGPHVTAAAAGFHEGPAAPVNQATLEELADRVRVLESRVKGMLVGFAILAVAAIIWPLVLLALNPSQGTAPKAGPAATTPAKDAARPAADEAPLLPLK